uniref:Coiled-coil domain-containing protein 162-like n=1 Tax=Sphenodon punctatus TaxID=8508 RepID=A0A8D0GF26_SPHPU
MFKMLPEKAGYRALRQTLQVVSALHDIVSYLFSFAQLGNTPGCFDSLCPEPLTADWGGTERIGNNHDAVKRPQDQSSALRQDQQPLKQRFSNYSDFCLLREAFLSSGNVSAYQSITDNMYHGLPPLSNTMVRSVFASQFWLPQPLDPRSPRTETLFPWRAFLADGGPFPGTISNLNPINYNMQLCLCGLSDEGRRVAHGELVGMQFQLEDVLCRHTSTEWSSDHFAYRDELSGSQTQSTGKTSKTLPGSQNSVTSCTLLRSSLIIWKQLEVLKAEWGRIKLKVEDINTLPLYKQFSELYRMDILYPAMKAIARQMSMEEEYEGLVTTSPQSVLPPKGASEIVIKTSQLQKLLESLEIHMIHEVQKKISREMTLVISERAREERSLPTELWKHQGMQENFSVVRPEIVESFVQRLMESYQETDGEITFKKDHLQKSLTALGCDIMARERSNFETYSMFYENLLRQEHQLLYRKEQVFTSKQMPSKNFIAELSHEIIMEITALRARLTDLGGENLNLKEKMRKEVQDNYEKLVQNLFVTCLHLKGKLDEYRLNMSRRVFEIISEVRKEGVDNMIHLKKKLGSTEADNGLKEHLAKVRVVGLLVSFQEAIQNKTKSLNAKMMAEQEVILFRQQLGAVKKALAQSQAENERLKKQLDKQREVLQEVEHRMTQEARKRQQLDLMKAANLERMLEGLGEREGRLQCLTEEAEKSSKIGQLQQRRIKNEMRQLTQERSLKLDAFQRVGELQCQLYDLEHATSYSSTGRNVIFVKMAD